MHFTNSYEESASNSEVTLSLEVDQIKKYILYLQLQNSFLIIFHFLDYSCEMTLHVTSKHLPFCSWICLLKKPAWQLELDKSELFFLPAKKTQTNVSLPVEGRTDVAYRSVETLVSSLMTSPVGSWSEIKQKLKKILTTTLVSSLSWFKWSKGDLRIKYIHKWNIVNATVININYLSLF